MLAWWDYGYQISGMAKRVTLADGNTWNHEHIALVGLCLTSPEEEAHALTRHLADYVLVWKGGGHVCAFLRRLRLQAEAIQEAFGALRSGS